jgi:hypothetical protein
MGTGEDAAPPPNGLAADPYAEDLPIGLRQRRPSRWLVVGLIVLVVVVVLIAFVALRLRGA